MKPCGCRGQRFCLLCEELILPIEQSLSKKQFIYCSLCARRAFRSGLENHQSHLENLIELEDYVNIDGIFVSDGVIDLDLENELVQSIDQYKWVCSQSGRRKQDFGPQINFKKRKLKVGKFTGLPLKPMQILEQLIDENASIRAILRDFRVAEVCNLEYQSDRGSSIEPHFDDFYFWGPQIVTLNLLSSTKLILTKDDKSNELAYGNHSKDQLNNFEIVINLKRRSLLVLGGEARYEWLHGIKSEHITGRRLVVTYRSLAQQFLPGEFLFNDQIDRLINLASNRI